jgi:hypothetical protein
MLKYKKIKFYKLIKVTFCIHNTYIYKYILKFKKKKKKLVKIKVGPI